jgi:hypothetical protein
MGAYLAKPNTEKSSEDGSYSTVKYGSSAMQGWRINMVYPSTLSTEPACSSAAAPSCAGAPEAARGASR